MASLEKSVTANEQGIAEKKAQLIRKQGAKQVSSETTSATVGKPTPRDNSATQLGESNGKSEGNDMCDKEKSGDMEVDIREKMIKRQPSGKRINQCVRYEDWITIDDAGEVHVHTREITNDLMDGQHDETAGTQTQCMMEDIQNHAPRPPDHEDKRWQQSVQLCEQDSVALEIEVSKGVEFEFAARSDSIMEHLDEPSASLDA